MIGRPILYAFLLLSIFPQLASGQFLQYGGQPSQQVSGYMRSNGTYVEPYRRTFADGNFYNNWSTKGNINPYTLQEGTKVTPPGHGGENGGRNAPIDLWRPPYRISILSKDVRMTEARVAAATELYNASTMDPVGDAIAEKLANERRLRFQTPPKVRVRNGVTILLGKVAHRYDAAVAEVFLRLDPSVSKVENLLIIDETSKATLNN